jgi:hypothetical protein
MPTYATSKTIINRAAIELSLISAEVANPFTSTEANMVLLRHLLNSLGERLVREHNWSHLKGTAQINTEVDESLYALPAAVQRIVSDTYWDQTRDLPLVGPLSSQTWAVVQATEPANAGTFLFRVVRDKLEIHPTPSAAFVLAYEYISAYWVTQSGQANPNAEAATASTDVVNFDVPLMIAGLKLAFREAKGLDTTAYQNAYDRALSLALGNEGAPPVLSLAQPRDSRPHFPGLPWTNWGTT